MLSRQSGKFIKELGVFSRVNIEEQFQVVRQGKTFEGWIERRSILFLFYAEAPMVQGLS